MKNKANQPYRLLVIDANIARSAGGENAIHPTSQHCRDTLKLILELAHHAAMSPPLLDEWKRHRSVYARTWLHSMFARKRVAPLSPKEHRTLRQAVDTIPSLTGKDRAAVFKDLHLVETAIACDRIILSLDDTMKKLITFTSQVIKNLRDLSWANPDSAHEDVKVWLSHNCYSRLYCIGTA
jgi:hypothetical protein